MIQFTADKTKDSNTPLPDGDYFLTCTDAQEKKSSKGNDMVEMEMTVCVGPYENRHFKYWLTFIDAGSDGHGITLHALHAFGLPYDGSIRVGEDDFKGKTVKASVGVGDPYKGRVRNKIVDFYILNDDQMSEEGSAAASAQPEPVKEPVAVPAPQPTAAVKAVFGKPAGKKVPWAK